MREEQLVLEENLKLARAIRKYEDYTENNIQRNEALTEAVIKAIKTPEEAVTVMKILLPPYDMAAAEKGLALAGEDELSIQLMMTAMKWHHNPPTPENSFYKIYQRAEEKLERLKNK